MHSKLSTAATRKILVIDDEPDNISLLTDVLTPKYKVISAYTGSEGVLLAQSEKPDIVLLDLIMPHFDGIKTCQILRNHETTQHIPVIVVTGTADRDQRIQALLSGADDVVTRPFEARELLARIQSKIRRIEERDGANLILRCGNLLLDLHKLEATLEDKRVPLSVLEFNLLKYLVQNKNRVVSRQKILDGVWRNPKVSGRTVDAHMATLRKKLVLFDHVVVTVYAAGYILKENYDAFKRYEGDANPS